MSEHLFPFGVYIHSIVNVSGSTSLKGDDNNGDIWQVFTAAVVKDGCEVVSYDLCARRHGDRVSKRPIGDCLPEIELDRRGHTGSVLVRPTD